MTTVENDDQASTFQVPNESGTKEHYDDLLEAVLCYAVGGKKVESLLKKQNINMFDKKGDYKVLNAASDLAESFIFEAVKPEGVAAPMDMSSALEKYRDVLKDKGVGELAAIEIAKEQLKQIAAASRECAPHVFGKVIS